MPGSTRGPRGFGLLDCARRAAGVPQSRHRGSRQQSPCLVAGPTTMLARPTAFNSCCLPGRAWSGSSPIRHLGPREELRHTVSIRQEGLRQVTSGELRPDERGGLRWIGRTGPTARRFAGVGVVRRIVVEVVRRFGRGTCRPSSDAAWHTGWSSSRYRTGDSQPNACVLCRP